MESLVYILIVLSVIAMILIQIICIGWMATQVSKWWKRKKQPHACPHGHEDWDDCPVCRH